jgi:hypothetical protein
MRSQGSVTFHLAYPVAFNAKLRVHHGLRAIGQKNLPEFRLLAFAEANRHHRPRRLPISSQHLMSPDTALEHDRQSRELGDLDYLRRR